uniref:two-component response regulator-like APRR3 isoform X2 n=1 Tax=Erigeron canadensis TaxID=72917 RepID=UPI001CB8ABFD|nr:two-component response regulator-like APRR3 isoform X2 [Erigeron canadensis]
MRRVGVSSSSIPVAKGSAELNHHNRKELKQVRDGGGQSLSEEDESRINEDSRRVELVISKDVGQRQHPQGPPLVQWERFLPFRSLKVLLVEDDDCTRHVVGALLRNCSYEVTAVANGLEAWKVLIDLNKQIDLVLTEVVMPYLSGIGLLSKIMNHIPRKNIPVVMMSSDDSMGIVFNCLSKGAVDFLVKPIRKNELKNLWQHVWRKCHSSSGSESESGIHAHRPTNVRSNKDSDDDDSEEDDDVSIGLTTKDGSDNGSGNQSSWSRKAVEVESAKYSWDHLAGTPDSTCAHVIHSSPDTVSTKKQGDAVETGKDLEIGVPRNSETNMDLSSKEVGEPNTMSTNNVTVAKSNSMGSPTLELSLKRSRDFEDPDTSTHTRNVLRQSGLSAFSRYNNTTSNGNQAPTGIVGSCSPLDFTLSSETGKPVNILSNSNGAPNQPSNGSSTPNNDMGSSTNIAFSKPEPPADDTAILPGPSEGDKAQFQVRHHHHHYHHHHHHVHKTQQQQTAIPDEGGSSRNMVSNVAAPAEGNAANYGSASGSNNKSNGENGSSGQKGNSYAEGGDNGVAEKSKNGNGSGSGSGSGRGSGVDPDRLAHREAALNKFRQKRKERCFEKKVRYQSRKKLAEQRPRVRGQFVRQGVNGKDADS